MDGHGSTDAQAGASVQIGQPVRRKEDWRLLTGNGNYADDARIAGITYAHFVRSPYAHACIRSINLDAAKAVPGVLAVLSGHDAEAAGLGQIVHTPGGGGGSGGTDIALHNRDGSAKGSSPHALLQTDRVRFVGEAVVMVIGESAAAAKDGAEQVEIDYEELPSATYCGDAAAATAPLIWDELPSNVCVDADVGHPAEVAAIFDSAPHRTRFESWIQRVTSVHMEPRCCTASYDAASDLYTVNAAVGHGVVRMKDELAKVLKLPRERIRVLVNDVGGNFGARNAFYPEFALIAWASRLVGRPVKHLAERQEAMVSDYQARDLLVEAELALDKDGNFLALRSSNLCNVGAHIASFTALVKGVEMMTGNYAIPIAHVRGRAVVSNTPSTIPYRSAGRPEAIYVIERLVDLAAREHGFDRVELRRRNLIRKDAFPYPNPLGITYDSGDYEGVMDIALRLGDWDGFPARKAEARKRGKLRGIGLANYLEVAAGMPRERAEITVVPEGRVDVVVGTLSTGQGHETSFAQLISDWMAVPFDQVRIIEGDSDIVLAGGGSHSGRSMRLASIVMQNATQQIIAKGREIAAHMLEAAVQDIDFAGGQFRVKGTDRIVGLFEVAAAARDRAELPETLRGPLGGASEEVSKVGAYPFGAHVCEVEIDPDTGVVNIARYAAVDDVGRAVNPMILHGQTHGGIVCGLGQVLRENSYYDRETGQMLAGSFMDYAMPRADDFPSFVTELSEVPTPTHPLGIRPGGEGGTTPALGVAINAIVDALTEFGVTHIEMPATSERIWRAIQGAKV